MTGKINQNVLIAGAVVLIVLALALIFRQASVPHETINSFKDVPPKGAGRMDRN